MRLAAQLNKIVNESNKHVERPVTHGLPEQSGLQRSTVGVVLLRRAVERLGRVFKLRTDLTRHEVQACKRIRSILPNAHDLEQCWHSSGRILCPAAENHLEAKTFKRIETLQYTKKFGKTICTTREYFRMYNGIPELVVIDTAKLL